MEDAMSLDVHREFAQRVDEHLERIDARLKILEEETKSYTQLAISIEKLGISTEKLCVEMKEQSERLKALEDRDGQKWRSTMTTVFTVVIGAVLGFVFSGIGIGI